MRIRAKQLDSQLKRGLASLYAVHGPEALVALEAADRIREAARAAGCDERKVFFAEPGADWGELAAAAANLSLFSTRRLLELRVPTGKPGTEGARAIEAWCEALKAGAGIAEGGDTLGLVALPELDWQQQKSRWFEALDAAGVVVEAQAISRDELPEWLAERFARLSRKASLEALEWLANRVEGNLLAARQEVDKLDLLLPPGEVTLEAIRDAVADVARFDRDALLEAIHARDAARIVRVVRSLEAEGEPLPLLLWTLAEELRAMMAAASGERARRYAAPEMARATAALARLHDAASFDRELLRAHRIDRMIKGVEPGNPWEGVIELALGLAARPVLEQAA